MPTFMELQKRLKRTGGTPVRSGADEMLVADVRGRMRPGEFIAEKLHAALTVERPSTPSTRRRISR